MDKPVIVIGVDVKTASISKDAIISDIKAIALFPDGKTNAVFIKNSVSGDKTLSFGVWVKYFKQLGNEIAFVIDGVASKLLYERWSALPEFITLYETIELDIEAHAVEMNAEIDIARINPALCRAKIGQRLIENEGFYS